MQHDFWLSRWQNNQIGFHLAEANPLMVKHFSALNLAPNCCVFVPLCGKTLDVHWLLAQGYQVVGVELSQLAVEALFTDLNLTPDIVELGELKRYSAKNLTVLNGDFFSITSAMLGNVDAIYDRAALVALPQTMRLQYTAHLCKTCKNAPQLLVSFDYDQSLIDGPPFSVNADEIQQHYAKHHAIQLLESSLLEGGLKGSVPALEQVWLLCKHR
jgi:thiopurine S-methyltransferase